MFTMFYLNSMVYWLYSFKYLVISIEVPRHFSEKPAIKCTQTSYNVVKWLFIVINFGLCLWLSIVRSQIIYRVSKGQNYKKLLPSIWGLESIQTFWLLVIGGMLLEAVRRFRKSFMQNEVFVENKKTMQLHVVVLFGHLVVLILLECVLADFAVHKTKEERDAASLWRSIYCIT